ncbi:MAG: aromatic amino acid lyase, partial [Thermoplasmata archaeon]
MQEPDDPPEGVVRINGNSLTIEKVVRVSRDGAKVELDRGAKERMARSRKSLEKLVEDGRVIYAVNTGVGELVDVRIQPEEQRLLQVNLLR